MQPQYHQLTDEARRMVEEARSRFRAGVVEATTNAMNLAAVFENAIGEVSSDEALEAWKRECITALRDQQGGQL